MIRHFGLAVMAGLAIWSVAASGQTAPAKASGPAADANVYIIRTHVMPVYDVVVKVDGRKVASLKNEHYTAVHLAPGQHDLLLTFSVFGMDGGSTQASIDVKDGGPAYFEYTSETKPTYNGFNRTWYVTELSELDAQKEIAVCCTFKAPVGTD